MAERKVKRRKLTQVPVGDMRDEIAIHEIEMQTGKFNDASFCQQYTQRAIVFAKVEDVESVRGGEEFFAGVDLNGATAYIMTTRYIDWLDTKNRIIYQNETYEIARIVNPEKRNKYSVIGVIINGDRTKKANL